MGISRLGMGKAGKLFFHSWLYFVVLGCCWCFVVVPCRYCWYFSSSPRLLLLHHFIISPLLRGNSKNDSMKIFSSSIFFLFVFVYRIFLASIQNWIGKLLFFSKLDMLWICYFLWLFFYLQSKSNKKWRRRQESSQWFCYSMSSFVSRKRIRHFCKSTILIALLSHLFVVIRNPAEQLNVQWWIRLAWNFSKTHRSRTTLRKVAEQSKHLMTLK